MLSVDDAKRLAKLWRNRFPDEAEFEQSWTRYMDTATVPDEARLEAWLAKDLAKSEVKHAGIVAEPVLPIGQDFDLPAEVEDRAIAAGDEHDWTGINEPGWTIELHEQNCRRCQMGVESRRRVDQRAQDAGKEAFPRLGHAVRWR